MDITALIRAIVTPLVNDPDAVVIDAHETDDYMAFDLTVAPDDVGRIIGKQGRVAQSIRTLVYSVKAPYTKRVRLNILDAGRSK
ncbi:hypothetical protein IV56_GL000891 [Lacticaseibacillus saniviri JCM 17471 = DSM 24301]|uniref:RNA-binding protein KhpA n=2 Tax=Lacticaseibacillus saniviri TaxID=931533 RepID=A0A0R2MZ36_9LACO|nr:KH domain-containing protein [Lacticaseibacillus saniviri]KRO18612.1 hypothetical protein IV56_GL000891 [Lacticaseibacillus saniviri JCM 17471 = DSM 24301]